MFRLHISKLKLLSSIYWKADWLKPHTTNRFAAYCSWCKVVLDAHKNNLYRHSVTKRHISISPSCSTKVDQSDNIIEMDSDSIKTRQANKRKSKNWNISSEHQAANKPENSTPIVPSLGKLNNGDSINSSGDLESNELELHSVILTLKTLFPLEYASDWDNVGLLIEPSSITFVKNILLTNDLTEKVLDEAISKNINLIISYHPPLFKPMKTLTQSSWKERIASRCLENRIAVYSPHTALDAVKGGINDWLLTPFFCSEIKPIEKCFISPRYIGQHEYDLSFSVDNKTDVIDKLKQLGISMNQRENSNYHVSCNGDMLPTVLSLLSENDLLCQTINKVPNLPMLDEGAGRVAKLMKPVTISEIVEDVKEHLGLSNLRLALSNLHTNESLINSIAVCAGSGSSVLRNASADLLITGEMSHHEILDFVHKGYSVILCEHSNTERGYFTLLQQVLKDRLKLNILISELDCDPIKIV